MKYLKLFENFEDYNPYDLMVMFPDERLKLFIEEIEKWEPNLNLVGDLISLGTINVQDNSGWAPLHYSVMNGRTEIVRMLIDAGAKLNVQSNIGYTPLHRAAINGQVEIARLLIDAGAYVDVQDKSGYTPLHRATEYREIEIARMLIDAGARKDIPNEDGKFPYDLMRTEELKKLLKP